MAESLLLKVATLADATQRDAARTDAVVRQAQIGDVEGALLAAAALAADDRMSVLRQIAVEQARRRGVAGAVKTHGDIRDGDARAGGLIDIAKAQLEGKDRAGAEKSLSAAAELAATLPATGKAELLDEIGAVRTSMQVAAGDVAGAHDSAMAVKSFRARCGLLQEVGRRRGGSAR